MFSNRIEQLQRSSTLASAISVFVRQGKIFIMSCPGARFSKVPKLFGRISSYIIHFVSSKRKHLEARNFAFILIFIPFTTYEKTGFTELAGHSFTNGFSGPESFRDFRETGPWPLSGFVTGTPVYFLSCTCAMVSNNQMVSILQVGFSLIILRFVGPGFGSFGTDSWVY